MEGRLLLEGRGRLKAPLGLRDDGARPLRGGLKAGVRLWGAQGRWGGGPVEEDFCCEKRAGTSSGGKQLLSLSAQATRRYLRWGVPQ